MVVGPIEMTGMVTRTADLQQMRPNDENRMFIDNTLAQARVDKLAEDKNKQVITKDNVEHHEYNYDAKDGGNGAAYGGSGSGSNRKKKEEEADGRVIIKSKSKGFDFRI